MLWRIFQEEANRGSFNMAADEYLLTYSKQPCIRFYQWQPACISIGYNQLLSDINIQTAREEGIEIVRRPTGGRAVFHDTQDYTYSVISPLALFGDVQKAYAEICSWLLSAFKEIGIRASLNGTNDIVIGKKKISGNAMVLRNNTVLQHGTIITDANFPLMSGLLNFKGGKERIASVKEYSTKEFKDILFRHFAAGKEYAAAAFTEEEKNSIQQLALQKYANPSWTQGTANEKSKGVCHITLG